MSAILHRHATSLTWINVADTKGLPSNIYLADLASARLSSPRRLRNAAALVRFWQVIVQNRRLAFFD